MKINYTKSAMADLTEIYRYIAIENYEPENADRLIEAIMQGIETILPNSPRAGRVIREDGERFIVIKQHTIVYEICDDSISIAAVYGKGQNWR